MCFPRGAEKRDVLSPEGGAVGPGYDAPGAPFAHSTRQEHREDKMLITFFRGTSLLALASLALLL